MVLLRCVVLMIGSVRECTEKRRLAEVQLFIGCTVRPAVHKRLRFLSFERSERASFRP
jgi:hypothetical protein